MAISKARKEELVAQYKDLLGKSEAVFLTEYTGLTVQKMEALREEIQKRMVRFMSRRIRCWHWR